MGINLKYIALLGTACLACFIVGIHAQNGERGEVQQLATEDMLVPAGCRVRVQPNDLIHMNYVGFLEDGTEFDSSYGQEKSPIIFKVGGGQVIKGWETGVVGMCIGGKRKLTIPPRMAYGSKGYGSVPPKATVIFEVELMKIDTPPTTQNVFMKFDMNGDGFLDITEVTSALNQAATQANIPMLSNMDETTRNGMVTMLFMQMDKDRDSLLSPAEFKKIPGISGMMGKDEL